MNDPVFASFRQAQPFMVFNPSAAMLTIASSDGEPLVVIDLDDLSISFHPAYKPDEAAVTFWQAIAAKAPRSYSPAVTAAELRKLIATETRFICDPHGPLALVPHAVIHVGPLRAFAERLDALAGDVAGEPSREDLLARIRQLEQNLDAAQAEAAERQKSNAEIIALQAERICVLEFTVDRFKGDNRALHLAVDRALLEIDERDEQTLKLELELSAAGDDRQETVGKLCAATRRWEECRRDVVSLRHALDRYARGYERMANARDDAHCRVVNLERELEQRRQLVDQRVAELERELAEAKLDAAQARTDFDDTEALAEQRIQRIHELEDAVNARDKNNAFLERRVQYAAVEAGRLSDECNRARAEADELWGKHNALEYQVARLRKMLAARTSETTDALRLRQLHWLREEAASARSEAGKFQDEAVRLKDSLRRAEDEATILRGRLAIALANLDVLSAASRRRGFRID